MNRYIEYVGDHFLFNLIGVKMFQTTNPYNWMQKTETIEDVNLTNMLSKETSSDNRVFTTDADF